MPEAVVTVETRADLTEVILLPAEEAIIERAVEKRRREFATVRACAREALAKLGLPPTPVISGARGEPLWPSGVVGSITHCDDYRACAVARSTDIASMGIDAEPHAALPEGLLSDIAGTQELSWLSKRRQTEPDIHWDRLLFSAKESVYKAWFPVAKRWLGFNDVVVTVDIATKTFVAQLLVAHPVPRGRLAFSGRWLVADGLVLTAIAATAL